MPSIISKKESLVNTYATSTKVSKTHLGSTVGARQEGDFGIVNYVNGIPVSIQLPTNKDHSHFGNSWKENMQKRNNKL
jgi:hypothetical protein